MGLLSESSSRSSLSSLLGEEDLEANRPEPLSPGPVEIEPEYQTPARIKYAWLGSYMVLAMAMPVHNKIILEKVSNDATPRLKSRIQSSHATLVQLSLASDCHAWRIFGSRCGYTLETRILQAIKTLTKRPSGFGYLLDAL